MTSPIYTNDPAKGQILAGYYNPESKTFFKDVVRAKHFFRIVSGYGIQSDVYEGLLKEGCQNVIIKESDTGNILESYLSTWTDNGGNWTGRNGKQRTLSEKYMEVKGE